MWMGADTVGLQNSGGETFWEIHLRRSRRKW